MFARERHLLGWRVGIDDAEHMTFVDAERDSKHRTNSLQDQRLARKSRILLSVTCEHCLAVLDDLGHDRTADTHFINRSRAAADTSDLDLHLFFVFLVAKHYDHTFSGYGIKHERCDLVQSVVKPARRQQCNAHL